MYQDYNKSYTDNMDDKVKDNILDKVALGTRIKTFRKSLNLTQEDIAEMFDISNAYYGQVERGESLSIFVAYIKF